jgi:anthranilate phosphoribosyltransferase
MFAPMHHSAMKHAIGPRKALGLRTIFNILGPMTNPAGVRRMLIGVYDRALLRPVAAVLGRLGADHVLVVRAEDGLDEISLAAPTRVAEWRDGVLTEWTLEPKALGVEPASLEGLAVQGADDSLALIRKALGPLDDRDESARKAAAMTALNAGAALYVAGVEAGLADGVDRARHLIDSGAALERLDALAELTRSF